VPDTVYRSIESEQRVKDWCRSQLAAWPVPHTSLMVESSAGSTHLLTAGSVDAPTVMYLPGTNFNAATSLAEVALLAREWRVVVPDVPGQPGLSTGHRVRSARLNYLGYWLDGIIETLGVPVTLVGHSLGAAIALASCSPQVETRALLCPAGLVRLQTPPSLLWASVRWVIRPGETSSRALLRLMGSPAVPPSEDLIEWMTLVGRATRTSLAPMPLPATVLAKAAERPVWVGAGDHDVFLPHRRVAQAARSRLGCEAVSLDQGHLLTAKSVAGVSLWLKQVTS